MFELVCFLIGAVLICASYFGWIVVEFTDEAGMRW